jgi:hypothetical protein
LYCRVSETVRPESPRNESFRPVATSSGNTLDDSERTHYWRWRKHPRASGGHPSRACKNAAGCGKRSRRDLVAGESFAEITPKPQRVYAAAKTSVVNKQTLDVDKPKINLFSWRPVLSLINGDDPARRSVEAGRCQESFCQDESSCSGEVRSEDGVRFLDGVRFRGELLAGDKGHSQDEAHSPSQTHSVDEAPQDVAQSCGARFPGEAGYSLVCSRSEE